jgi:hypothetical protein
MESPEAISGRWGVVRAEWLFHPDVGVDEFALLACLTTYQDKAGFCWPSQSTLAARLKRSRPWIIKVLNRLEELGLIERTRRTRGDGGLRSCLYRIVPSEPAAGGKDQDDAVLKQSPEQSPGMGSPTASLSGSDRDRGCPEGDTNQTQPIQERISLPREGEPASDGVAKQVPQGWMPSAEDLAWAAQAHPSIDAAALTEAFITGCRAKGYRYIDAGCAWRGWFANQERWRQERGERSHERAVQVHEHSAHRTDRHAGQAGSKQWIGTGQRTGAGSGRDERNAAAADACLERILARRAGHPSAGVDPR